MYVGIDIGGTGLRAGLVDETGRVLAWRTAPLYPYPGGIYFVRRLAELTAQVAFDGHVAPNDLSRVGIGVPGAVADGNILYVCNIPKLRDVDVKTELSQYLDIPVTLGNDADCAAAGEYLCGAGRGTRNFITVTLGTGIGAGLILNGKLFSAGGMAGEAGHMVVERNGAPCRCGRRGCWESYASATGLVRMAKEAMEQHRESLLWKLSETGPLTGRMVFQAASQGDGAAEAACRDYVEYLGIGIVNLLNLFQPDVLAIGGGLSGAEDALLLEPLRAIVEKESYAARCGKLPQVVRAALGNRAGVIGAALLERAL